ncbi:MAG: glycosyltransferase family 2 protein [Solobacterium sp.]|nr:glycosyltransferase family 2 protein [Solobacterium sp.]
MKVLIIVPAYNEEKNLPVLIPKITAEGWDYIVINDGSTDNSAEMLREKGFNHMDLAVNAGLAAVTKMGFMYAHDHGYDAALVVDGDGQHPPVYIKDLVKKIEEGYDYVVGSRFIDRKKPMSMRMIGSRLICWAIRLKTGKTVKDPTSGMRALGRKTLQDFAENMNFIAEPDALVYVLRRGYSFSEIQVDMEERTEGVSYFHSPLKSARYMYTILMSILFLQW